MSFTRLLVDWLSTPGAEALFWRARKHQLAGRCDEAIALYSASIAKDPDYAWSYDARGNVHGLRGDMRAALADYEKAVALMPEHAGMLGNLGRALYLTGAFERGVAVLEQAVALEPDHANNKALLLEACSMAGHYQRVIDLVERMLPSASPVGDDIAFLVDRRGWARCALGDHRGALADFTRVIEAAPTERAFHERAKAHLALGELEPALADIAAALRINGEGAYSHYLSGYTRARQGDERGALADYERSIARDPAFADAWRGRAEMRRKLGDVDGAIADLTRLIELEPGVDAYRFERGLALIDKGEHSHAAEDFSSCLGNEQLAGVAYLNRGLCHERLHDEARMLPDYAEALKLMGEPVTWLDHNNRAWAHFVLGEVERSLPLAERAVALQPGHAEARNTLGHVLEALDRPAEAIELFREALALRPDAHVEARARAALARLGAG